MKPHTIPVIVLASILAACGGKEPSSRESGMPAQAPAPGGSADHGTATDLGTVTVAGREFDIVRLGDVVPGQEAAFEVHAGGAAADELATLNVYLWVESEDGTQLSAPAKGSMEGDALHFHVTPRAGEEEPVRAVLRLRADGVDERGSLPLDGHGHEHRDGPHHGVPATLQGGDVTGHLELKLHDDKGDLELWLAGDEAFERPFDLPLDATVEVEFVDVGGRTVTLRPRNRTTNEDEDGNPNIRDGRTNYFIYPTREDEDASWLQGEEFQSIVIVRFTRGEQELVSEEFVLTPHTH